MPNLPTLLLESLKEFDGFNIEAFVDAHREENKLTSIRLNPFKPVDLDFELGDAVPWSPGAYYLQERPSFTHDPLFQAGCYYVQEAGSMFIAYLLRQHLDFSQDLRVLDLCAAPGGKSTVLGSLISPESLLVANEIVKSRAGILVQNLAKWGLNKCVVTNNDPSHFSDLNDFFDLVVVDAPCSGSGLFRKQPEAIEEWSQEAVWSCSARQKTILEQIIPAIKDHGYLVYSTCSYSVQENEEIVQWLIETYGLEVLTVPVNAEWGIVSSALGYRFYPHLTRSEGFYCALLRKPGNRETTENRPSRRLKHTPIAKAESELLGNFVDLNQGSVHKIGQQLHLVNTGVSDFLLQSRPNFYLKKAGVCLGEIKGRDFVPNQELAWYPGVLPGVERVELDKENAIRFLKKESFSTPENTKGLALIHYRHYGLGWAKILSNRVNNYLPSEFRILK